MGRAEAAPFQRLLEAAAGSLAANKPGLVCFGAANPLGGLSWSLVAARTLLSSSFPVINWP